MVWPAVVVVRGGEASAAAQPATGGRSRRHDRRCFGRLEQKYQWLKKHDGRWMDIVQSLQLESFILTKLTKPLVRVNLVGPQVIFRNGVPQMSGEESFFGRVKLEYPRLKKKHAIRRMDIQQPLLLEPCVDYKLTKPCICVNSFLKGCVNLVRPEVCGRELIAHLRFVRMCSQFLNSNVIYYSPFTVC